MWKIFPSTAYVKNWMKFRTTTNLIKIAFSVNRSLCGSGVRSLGLFIGTQNVTKVTRIMIIELTPTKKDRTILNLKSMATAQLQDWLNIFATRFQNSVRK